MRVELSSKLFEVDFEAESLDELGYITSELDFPVDKGWMAKIILRPWPDVKAEVTYTFRYKPKDSVLTLVEHWQRNKYEHPIDIDAEQGDIPSGFILEFIQGLPSSMDYAT
jgi:hypothetical protein